MDYEKLGRTIAKERIKRGFTQEYLAEMADISTVFISQIETAKRKPSLETISKIATVLKVSIDGLMGNISDNTKYSDIITLLDGKTTAEVSFITSIIAQICSGISEGKIITQ